MGEHPDWISIPRAAKLLGIGIASARALVADGTLTVRRVGRSVPKVPSKEVLSLADRSTTPARSDQ